MIDSLFGRWRKSAAFTPSELEVLKQLIPEVSAEATALLTQAKTAPFVARKTIGNSDYEARIPFLEDDSALIEVSEDVESPQIEITEKETRRLLGFSTVILRGGFLMGLRGKALDGHSWPKDWNMGSVALRPPEVFTWLNVLIPDIAPGLSIRILEELVDWSQTDRSIVRDLQLSSFRFAKPATTVDICECEKRLAATLPENYKEFVTICNGFGIKRGRPYEILGTQDIAYLDDSKEWLGVTPLYEDGYVCFQSADRLGNCYLLTPDGVPCAIGDLRKHVRESIEWLESEE